MPRAQLYLSMAGGGRQRGARLLEAGEATQLGSILPLLLFPEIEEPIARVNASAYRLAAVVRSEGTAAPLGIALRRWGKIDEVAKGAIFLSGLAATCVIGTNLDVDGGTQLGDASKPRYRS